MSLQIANNSFFERDRSKVLIALEVAVVHVEDLLVSMLRETEDAGAFLTFALLAPL